MRESAVALVAGTVFGLGLAVADMTNPAKVQNFLDWLGHFDPSLAFVMGSALAASALGYRWRQRLPKSRGGDERCRKSRRRKAVVAAAAGDERRLQRRQPP